MASAIEVINISFNRSTTNPYMTCWHIWVILELTCLHLHFTVERLCRNAHKPKVLSNSVRLLIRCAQINLRILSPFSDAVVPLKVNPRFNTSPSLGDNLLTLNYNQNVMGFFFRRISLEFSHLIGYSPRERRESQTYPTK